MKKFVHASYSSIFWLWNLLFLLVIYVGILPNLAPFMIRDALAGEVPLTFMVTFAGLVAAPTLAALVGWFRLRRQPERLMRLFYGIEAPIVGLCLLRLFIIREMTPASLHLLGTLALCITVFGIELLCGYAARRPALAWLQMMGHSLMLMVGVYVGVLLTFYVVPALCVFIYSFLQFHWWNDLGNVLSTQAFQAIFWSIVGLALFSMSASLFFAMPFVMSNLYLRSWWRTAAAFGEQYGRQKAYASTAGVAIAWLLIFSALQQQPQVQAFALLDQPAATDRDRQELLNQSNLIRDGLVNAYLSSYRYLSPWEESNQLREMYRYVFDLSHSQAQVWQDFHNHWLSPFLYMGSRSDSEKAAEQYAEFFDAPIQRAERPAIQQALQSTVNRGEVQAGLLNINQRIVWLAQQQVTVQEQGDWADIELYEQYSNPTRQDQEIFYSFSLPESAVLTGVWLGETAQRDQRFRFTVSPRGAAQQVYNSEVERSNRMAAEDPALLEQVGPRQYRLRVFPIPARQFAPRPQTETPGELHLWMTYKVMRAGDQWPLPQLAEQRNIYWTRDTVRQRNGRTVRGSDQDWLEAALPAHREPLRSHQVTLSGGYHVTAQPLQAKDYQLPQAQHFAVVVDRSYSMNSHRQELTETFRWLRQHQNQNDVDLYLTASRGAQPERIKDLHQFDPAKATFYGSLQIPQMLKQFEQLQDATTYDAVLLVTDQGSYELSKDDGNLAIAAPLWVVHLGEELPFAYDDATLEAIQKSKGGVAPTLEEVMQRLATEAKFGDTVASVTDGYVWLVKAVDAETSDTATAAPLVQFVNQRQVVSESDFAPLAARQLLLKLSREQDLTQLAELDAVHAIAKSTEIVTPYSSMLVLVNDRQRELLRQAEAGDDRFNRTVEDGQENLTQPNNPLNAVAVPEPGTVVGMGIVAIALLVLKKRQPSPGEG